MDSTEDFSDYYNNTWVEPCDQEQTVGVVIGPYVHSVICVLGLIGNGLMLLTLCCSKRPQSVTQTLLLQLAVADLVIVLVLPGLVVMDLGAWPDAGLGCKLLRGGYSLSLYSAALLLAAVSADRYTAVVHARRRLGARTPGLSLAVSAIVWLTAVALSIPNFLFYDHYIPQHDLPQDLGHGNLSQDWGLDPYLDWELEDWNDSTPLPGPGPAPAALVCSLRFDDDVTAKTVKVAVPALQLTAGFMVPLVCMSFCYGSVLHTLLRGRTLCGEKRTSTGRSFRRDRAVRLVLMVALVFFLCHTPFNILLLWKTLEQFNEVDCQAWTRLDSALALAQTLALLHCVLNPLLYGFNSAPFRMAFCSVLNKLSSQRRPSSTSQSERSTHYTL